jgi:hypothetical protein
VLPLLLHKLVQETRVRTKTIISSEPKADSLHVSLHHAMHFQGVLDGWVSLTCQVTRAVECVHACQGGRLCATVSVSGPRKFWAVRPQLAAAEEALC